MSDTTTAPPKTFRLSAGVKCAIPISILFIVAFLAPLLIVLGFSFLPERTFGFTGELSLENYAHFFTEGYYKTFMWTFGLAFSATCCLPPGRISGGVRAGACVWRLGRHYHPDLRISDLRIRKPAPYGLEPGFAQRRRSTGLHHKDAHRIRDRHLAVRSGLNLTGSHLCLPSLHDLSHDARHFDGTRRNRSKPPATLVQTGCRSGVRSSCP